MRRKSTLTTGDVAAHCDVTPETAASWARSGKLKAYTTPGGHRRIRVSDFRRFLREFGLPPFEAGRRPRILIVDDDQDLVEVMAAYFRAGDEFDVATAHDGFMAGIQVATFKPDLIILDLMMPNLDGFDVLRQLKADVAQGQIIVIVVTGFPGDGNKVRALRCGAEAVLIKPLKPAELRRKVDDLLARRVADGAEYMLPA